MTEFMRPTVTTEEVNDTVARYIVEPLERGYGNTLGNSMRRVLLSSLDGAKATAIRSRACSMSSPRPRALSRTSPTSC